MANQADIKAVITAEDKASGVLKGFGDNVSDLGGKVLGVAKVAGESLLAAGAAAAGFGALSVKAYQESQDVQAQLNAALESTHHAAGLLTQDLNDQALALQRVTKFSDEQINASQAMLLTFTNIHGEIFQKTTPIILDLATAMHEDLQSASIQVGKALNDPITGITALHRIGVTFSQTQKDQIQGFVDANQLAKAQGVILAELTKEFGGSAVAAGKTFGGQLAILKNQLNDVEERVGSVIVNALTPFAVRAIKAVESLDWDKIIKRTIDGIKDFVKILDDAWQSIDRVYQQVAKYLEPKLKDLLQSIKNIYPVIRTFIDEYVNPLVESLGKAAGVGLVWVLGAIIDTTKWLLDNVFKPFFKFMDENKPIVYGLVAAFVALKVSIMIWDAVDKLRVAFETIQLVTIPNMVASLTSLNTFLVGFGGFAVIAAAGVAAFVAIQTSAKQTLEVVQHTLDQIKQQSSSTDNASIRSLQTAAAAARARGDQKEADRIADVIRSITTNADYRASGGNVMANRPYIVGEQGQELFIPQQSGKIIPNDQLNGMGSNISININAGAFMGSQIDARKYAMEILKSLQEIAAKKNSSVASMIGARS